MGPNLPRLVQVKRRYDPANLTEVLEHCNFHPVGALRTIRSLLAPGGRLHLSTPNAAGGGIGEMT